MLKLEIFDGTKTYMFPNGAIATPDIIRSDFPAVDLFPHVIEVNGNTCQAIQELQALRNIHRIDESLSDEEALLAIQDKINTPPEINTEPSVEERIAAALEFQNVLSM
ncbi:MAG TPA: hypothetical protein GXX75_03180 [Clostridiales bacterium]|nr:hypothetical protein [Clostridiales bacterium]